MSDTQGKCIWMSLGMLDSTAIRGWTPVQAGFEPDPLGNSMTIYRKSHRGIYASHSEYPTEMYMRKGRNDHKKAKRHFMTSGLMIISEESANVLRGFDIGAGSIYPVKLFHPDKKTQMEDNYYFLHIAEKKNAFLPKKSPVRRAPYGEEEEIWTPNPNHEDDQYVFSSVALDGVDLWMDDRIQSAFFMSDELAQAMKKAKIAKHWHLYRCLALTA